MVSFFKNALNAVHTQAHYWLQLNSQPPSAEILSLTASTAIYGQFGGSVFDGSRYVAARDHLGVVKKFYTRPGEGELVFADSFIELLPYEQPIYALPRGKVVEISPDGLRELANVSPAPLASALQSQAQALLLEQNYAGFAHLVERRLAVVFDCIKAAEDAGYTVFVALSGGLDSSTMAHYAKRFCANPIAVTLDLGGSEDAEKAQKIAAQLEVRHCVFGVSEDEILAAVEKAPLLCQDFRDFNVHCAALNCLLAEKINQWADANGVASQRMIITGDLMNEFVCDYEEEIVEQTRYYRLPRIGKKALQKHLIGGLDTSDREWGLFAQYGLECVQPYAAVYDLYEAVPESLLSQPEVKPLLNSHLVPEDILQHIPKSKLRAQVGDKKSMGVLGLCHKHGITEAVFKARLASGLAGAENRIPIMMGRYSTETLPA
ncbi:asparagine synthase-related protein [Teredinibacter turnerae]|uniref:asparagine synthase-related protein n=1 Tax=Teredinibacter turnerae TaxID=2426 RepID=UPI00036EFD1A|nr:asparagine synthase-related protein [Teredinibacter turnerae]